MKPNLIIQTNQTSSHSIKPNQSKHDQTKNQPNQFKLNPNNQSKLYQSKPNQNKPYNKILGY